MEIDDLEAMNINIRNLEGQVDNPEVQKRDPLLWQTILMLKAQVQKLNNAADVDKRKRELSEDRGRKRARTSAFAESGKRLRSRSRRRNPLVSRDESPEIIKDVRVDSFPDLVEQYSIEESGGGKGQTLLVAEELDGQANDSRKEHKRLIRVKHRALLQMARAVDSDMMLQDKPRKDQWASYSMRPSKIEEVEQQVPFVQNFMPEYLVTDIKKTGDLVYKVARDFETKIPIHMEDQPREKKVFTSSFEPADAALYPQVGLSEDTTRELVQGLGLTVWKKPNTVTIKEGILQDMAARARTSSHGTAMIEQLLRVIKVIGGQVKEEYESDSVEWLRAHITADADRCG
jgi:hypothetical protein